MRTLFLLIVICTIHIAVLADNVSVQKLPVVVKAYPKKTEPSVGKNPKLLQQLFIKKTYGSKFAKNKSNKDAKVKHYTAFPSHNIKLLGGIPNSPYFPLDVHEEPKTRVKKVLPDYNAPLLRKKRQTDVVNPVVSAPDAAPAAPVDAAAPTAAAAPAAVAPAAATAEATAPVVRAAPAPADAAAPAVKLSDVAAPSSATSDAPVPVAPAASPAAASPPAAGAQGAPKAPSGVASSLAPKKPLNKKSDKAKASKKKRSNKKKSKVRKNKLAKKNKKKKPKPKKEPKGDLRSGGKKTRPISKKRSKLRQARRLIAAKDGMIETYPYTVSIQKGYEHWCAGAILNPRLIITTANCLWKSSRMSRMRVRACSRHSDRGGQELKIQEVMKHPGWSVRKNPDNDVALFLVDKNIRFTDSCHAVDLPNRAMMPPFDDAWVTSWGAERRDGVFEKRHMTLQVYHARLMDRDKCNNVTMRFGVGVTENFICLAQAGRRAPCTRDTGAPAVSDGVLWGLASWGIRKLCGTERFPAMFSYIASHSNMDFIINATHSLMSQERLSPFLDRFPGGRQNPPTMVPMSTNLPEGFLNQSH